MPSPKSQYAYLKKLEKDSIDLVTVDVMLSLLEEGDVVLFGRVLGILASMKQYGEPLNQDQQRVLDLPKDLMHCTQRLITLLGDSK